MFSNANNDTKKQIELSNNLSDRKAQVDKKKSKIDMGTESIKKNNVIAIDYKENSERKESVFFGAFQSFFLPETKDNCTLNESNGDKKLLKACFSATYGMTASLIEDNELSNKDWEAHCQDYPCYLLSSAPANQDIKKLPLGYYLYRTFPAGIDQINVLISHAPEFGHEAFNLSECISRELIPILSSLTWPAQSVKSQWVKLDIKLEIAIVSLSKKNKLKIYHDDIFWQEKTSEKFSQFLSREGRKSQKIIGGKLCEPLVRENGGWANTITFFGNGLATAWYLGKPPRQYGYDTVINRNPNEQDLSARNNEIPLIISAISDRFINDNIIEVIDNAKKNYTMGNG